MVGIFRVEEFLKSKDFMRLENQINKGQWQSAIMTITRMQRKVLELDFHDFDRNLLMLRQCVMKKELVSAKNALAIIMSKRVALLNKD